MSLAKTQVKTEQTTLHRIDAVLLVGVQQPDQDETVIREQLQELEALATTLGKTVTGHFLAKIRQPQSRYLVGSGKAEQICEEAAENGCEGIIFDEELTPSQQRNWEKMSGLTVVDRQEVILGIFGQRARTREATLQVALAQADYDFSRLKRHWTHLSRQRGPGGAAAPGVKGEGEQQIELDARMVQERINSLRRQLREVRKQRQVQRQKRLENPISLAALVGYTNAGKSSLLNSVSQASVFTEDKLFATLDPTIRRITLPNKQHLLLADTVGFVRKLPHQLIEAFKATLEETAHADFLVEVLDATSRRISEQHETTRDVLKELQIEDKPVITVINKIDLIEENYKIRRLQRAHPDAVFISTRTGEGLDELGKALSQELERTLIDMRLFIPHSQYEVTAYVYRTCQVDNVKYVNAGTWLDAKCPPTVKDEVQQFEVCTDNPLESEELVNKV